MVRASGYLQTIDDFNHIVLKTGENGVPIYLMLPAYKRGRKCAAVLPS
jgi:Cu/Ag efflux pump CusA